MSDSNMNWGIALGGLAAGLVGFGAACFVSRAAREREELQREREDARREWSETARQIEASINAQRASLEAQLSNLQGGFDPLGSSSLHELENEMTHARLELGLD